MINEGKICADGLIDDLSERAEENHSLKVRIAGDEETVRGVLNTIPGVIQVQTLDSGEQGARDYLVSGTNGVDLRQDTFAAIRDSGLVLLAMKPTGMTLEDLFLKLTVKGEI